MRCEGAQRLSLETTSRIGRKATTAGRACRDHPQRPWRQSARVAATPVVEVRRRSAPEPRNPSARIGWKATTAGRACRDHPQRQGRQSTRVAAARWLRCEGAQRLSLETHRRGSAGRRPPLVEPVETTRRVGWKMDTRRCCVCVGFVGNPIAECLTLTGAVKPGAFARLGGRVDSPGEGQRRAGYRVAAAGRLRTQRVRSLGGDHRRSSLSRPPAASAGNGTLSLRWRRRGPAADPAGAGSLGGDHRRSSLSRPPAGSAGREPCRCCAAAGRLRTQQVQVRWEPTTAGRACRDHPQGRQDDGTSALLRLRRLAGWLRSRQVQVRWEATTAGRACRDHPQGRQEDGTFALLRRRRAGWLRPRQVRCAGSYHRWSSLSRPPARIGWELDHGLSKIL